LCKVGAHAEDKRPACLLGLQVIELQIEI